MRLTGGTRCVAWVLLVMLVRVVRLGILCRTTLGDARKHRRFAVAHRFGVRFCGCGVDFDELTYAAHAPAKRAFAYFPTFEFDI